MGLTKEEKKAKKEAKRLEKLKAEAEAQKKLKREQLQREIAAQAIKRGELDKSWRDLMLKIKEPVFKQDIEVMWHTFERALDKKDHLISYSIQLQNVADDQFQRTVASFCDTIDTMINKFLADLEALAKENDYKTAKLLKNDENDTARVTADQNVAETHLQLMIYHSHTKADNLVWTTRGENLVKEDEERNKYTNERDDLRSFLENNYNNMWDEFKAVLKAYVVDTADNQKKVRKLRAKENTMADIIASQGKKIANSDSMLKRLRTELAAYESGTKQAVFRDRRDRHRAAFFRLKKRLTDDCNLDTKQLARLVKGSDNTLEWIKAAHAKGEKILRIAALCRKYETQREKVLPYSSRGPYLPIQTKNNVRRHGHKAQSEDSLVIKAITSTSGLTRLWQKVANAELSKKALLREKEILEEENALIIQKVHELKEKSMTPDTLKCLCNKNERLPSNWKPSAVDGGLELLKYSKHH